MKKSHIHIHNYNHSFVFHIFMKISRNITFEIIINHIMKLYNLSQFYYLSSLDAIKKYINEIKIN